MAYNRGLAERKLAQLAQMERDGVGFWASYDRDGKLVDPDASEETETERDVSGIVGIFGGGSKADDKRWLKQLAEWKRFVEKQGHLYVRMDTVTSAGFKVGQWTRVQREKRESMSAFRIMSSG